MRLRDGAYQSASPIDQVFGEIKGTCLFVKGVTGHVSKPHSHRCGLDVADLNNRNGPLRYRETCLHSSTLNTHNFPCKSFDLSGPT